MAQRLDLKSIDIISELPDDIAEKLLLLLPIKDAVKTSVLSRNWRYKWTYIPELVFEDLGYKTDMHPKMVDRILLVHRGPIRKFEVSLDDIEDETAIDSWIHFLSRKNIRRFKIGFSFDCYVKYIVPSTLFSYQALSYLELFGCSIILKPPPTFEGLRNLKILRLAKVELPDDQLKIFENMISNLPVLEKLELDIIDINDSIKIIAPNLRHFFFRGNFDEICFLDAPHLIDVCIDIVYQDPNDDLTSNLPNIVGCLDHIEKFAMLGFLVECLVRVDPSRCYQLPVTYHHLSQLSLEVDLDDLNQILAIVGLLKSFPNLQKLEIYMGKYSAHHLVEDFRRALGQLDCPMNHLKMVNFNYIRGSQTELEFIKFLLANSPMLEVLSITSMNKTTSMMILTELQRFQHASANVKFECNEFLIFQ